MCSAFLFMYMTFCAMLIRFLRATYNSLIPDSLHLPSSTSSMVLFQNRIEYFLYIHIIALVQTFVWYILSEFTVRRRAPISKHTCASSCVYTYVIHVF